MTRLLIIKGEINQYNIPVYNSIGKEVDLTVGYTHTDASDENVTFKKLELCFKQIGPFIIIKNLRATCNQYDIVSFMPDFHFVNCCLLPFKKHKFKLINWSIGFKVSYTRPYNVTRQHNIGDWIFKKILNKCDASIFYMDKSKEFWQGTNLDLRKVFVAPNTADVLPIELNNRIKRNFLFVGSLYAGKGIDLLLKSFHEALQVTHSDAKLIIIGKGEMRKMIENFITENHLESNILLRGPIYDETILAKEFSAALLCISPTQAGLSVPKSMGYGVPFVTRKDAITGGEMYHISNNVNGLIYESDNELTSILVDSIQNQEKYLNMGAAAKAYYDKKATIKQMAHGAMMAVRYALSHNILS
jgi:glycosyltransferase involved in cell wall biosynthesis